MTDVDCEENAVRFIERMGLALEGELMPRIAGRILGLLLLEGGPFGLEEIAQQLQVSRGSVSTNTRLLIEKGMIERVTRPGDRRDYFQIGEAPGENMLRKGAERFRNTHQLIAEAHVCLAQEKPAAAARLARMERFYATVIRTIERALDELREADDAS